MKYLQIKLALSFGPWVVPNSGAKPEMQLLSLRMGVLQSTKPALNSQGTLLHIKCVQLTVYTHKIFRTMEQLRIWSIRIMYVYVNGMQQRDCNLKNGLV